jgi:AraC-like DNA-binding protein
LARLVNPSNKILAADTSRNLTLAYLRVTTKQKNLHKTLCDVTELAAAAGYSRAHFTRKFSEECGISPGKFLLDWRLRIAAQMLTADYSQIKSIARQTGFTDVSHFCRVFKQKYGLTPKAFRLSSISRNLQQNS